jgi:hypothetical protein
MNQPMLNRLAPDRNLSSFLAALSFTVAVSNALAFTYTNFSSTTGLNLVGASAVVGGALRLTPAAEGELGNAWAINKQQCATGFDTYFQFRISSPGSRPGTPSGADGLMFTVQNTGPTDPAWHPPLGTPNGSVGVFFNTFLNWPGCSDYTQCDVSDNCVGVVSNSLYLAQANLTPLGINLKDGAVHNVRVAFDGARMSVWLDASAVLSNVPVSGLGQAVDASGNAWVGFGAATGWAWEDHDLLSWSFSGVSSNRAPVALCADVVVAAGVNCQADASVNNGSFDPDGDPITVSQVPPGPYPLGTNRVTLIVTDDKGASNSCGALVIVLNNLPPLAYTDFNATTGLNLVGASAVVGGALRLTPAAEGELGTAWATTKQYCAAGFDTHFQFRFNNPGSRPGTPSGADGLMFVVQNTGPTDSALHLPLGGQDGGAGVFFNSFLNWPGCSDYTLCDASANSVGVVSNSLYLAQADLTPLGINLKDGAVHNAHVVYDGVQMSVWLDASLVLSNVPVPGLAQALDAYGNGWVGFSAKTGWAWESHDVLSWSFVGSSCNGAPVPQCTNVIVPAGTNCVADASIDNGSYDPDGYPITLSQAPPSPYPVGTNLVTLTVTDNHGASNSCSALVIVLDQTPPVLVCAPNKQVECGTVWSFDEPAATDDCGTATVTVLSTVTNASCGGTFTATRTWAAVDGATNTATCGQTVTVVDTTSPTIVCPAPVTVEFQDETGALASYVVTGSDTCSAVSLAATPASGSRFSIGVTPVQAIAVDACGNSNACYFTVTVLGAQGVKSNVLAELTALRATSPPSQAFAQQLDEAIQHLASSLNPAYWVDQTHLLPKGGNTAMNEEKLAAKTLADIMDAEGCPVDSAVLQGLIDRIVRCDRLLAVISIQEAANAGLNPKKVAEDLAMVAKGDEEADKGLWANAIESYRNAWRHALQLRLQVSLNPDGSTLVQFVGNHSKSYRIEVSTDLVNWAAVGTCAADSDGDVRFTDAGSSEQPQRFYRAVEQ